MASEQAKPPDPLVVDVLGEFENRNAEIKAVCKKMEGVDRNLKRITAKMELLTFQLGGQLPHRSKKA